MWRFYRSRVCIWTTCRRCSPFRFVHRRLAFWRGWAPNGKKFREFWVLTLQKIKHHQNPSVPDRLRFWISRFVFDLFQRKEERPPPSQNPLGPLLPLRTLPLLPETRSLRDRALAAKVKNTLFKKIATPTFRFWSENTVSTFDFRIVFSTTMRFDSDFLRLRLSLRIFIKFHVRYSEKHENSRFANFWQKRRSNVEKSDVVFLDFSL